MLCFITINGACVSYQVFVPLQRMLVCLLKLACPWWAAHPVHFCVVRTARRSMWSYSSFRLHLRGIAFCFIYPFFFFFFYTLQPGEANRFVLQQQEALNAKYIGRQEREVERGGGGADV